VGSVYIDFDSYYFIAFKEGNTNNNHIATRHYSINNMNIYS